MTVYTSQKCHHLHSGLACNGTTPDAFLLIVISIEPYDYVLINIYIGPDKPEGNKVQNWIPTEAGRAWFPYFRLYSPTEAFLDRSWVLPDIEKVK